jgi:hypothetical protein
VDAGKGQIVDRSWSTMLQRENVIDLEWRGNETPMAIGNIRNAPVLFAKPGE